jgi:hypothetical protein
MNKRPIFSTVWDRIASHGGELFETKNGVKFAYRVEGQGFFPEGRNHRIDFSDFENAYANVPCDGPSSISQGIRLVRGPSYIWAVLHDRRIRQSDW